MTTSYAGNVEVRTQPLDGAALVSQPRLVAELCLALDPSGLNVSYGWACHLEIDALYTDHRIESHHLLDFLDESARRRAFTLGQSDLHIHGAGIDFCFTLCHESDIHFESADPALVSRVVAAWKAAGLSVHEVKESEPPVQRS